MPTLAGSTARALADLRALGLFLESIEHDAIPGSIGAHLAHTHLARMSDAIAVVESLAAAVDRAPARPRP